MDQIWVFFVVGSKHIKLETIKQDLCHHTSQVVTPYYSLMSGVASGPHQREFSNWRHGFNPLGASSVVAPPAMVLGQRVVTRLQCLATRW